MSEKFRPSPGFTGTQKEAVVLKGETLAGEIIAQYDQASLLRVENSPAFKPPEAHAGHIDLFYVAKGESTFRYGGELDGHRLRSNPDGSLDENELVGVDIIDGEETQLTQGDWLWLPPLTPHQHYESDPNTQLMVVKIPVISKEHAGPSRVPTQWETKGAVKEAWMRQFEYFGRLMELVRDVPGDFVECGVGEGNTFTMLAHYIGIKGWADSRKLWGFDSFEGWPEPTEYDDSPRKPKKGEWRVSEEMVERALNGSDIPSKYPDIEIEIIKGFFSDTLPHFPTDRPIAFVHADADLYPGYQAVLENLFPLVSPGGIIALDEYHEFPNLPEYDNGKIEKWPGCTIVVDDFLVKHGLPEPIFDDATGKYYIIKPTE